MPNHDAFEYDVALSYATQDAKLAEEFARLLSGKGLKVFRDEYRAEVSPGWGKDMVDHLVNLYARKARYCLLLVSRHYPLASWTVSERTSAQERALRDADEYIVPILVEGHEIPGVKEVAGLRDLRQHSLGEIVHWLEGQLAETKSRSGPAAKSHDLRSGNVPSEE